MANITVNNFNITIGTGDQMEFNVSFTLIPTATEARLEIPSHVYAKLMQMKGTQIDPVNLYANDQTTIDSHTPEVSFPPGGPGTGRPGQIIPDSAHPASRTEDIQGSDWMYVGLYSVSGTNQYSFIMNKSNLPSDSSTERWYITLVARPDIVSGVSYSEIISCDIGD